MAWHDAEFLGSLSSVAPRTVDAYRRDLAGFAEWAERGDVHGPEDVDRLLLRRYVAHLATRQYAKRQGVWMRRIPGLTIVIGADDLERALA